MDSLNEDERNVKRVYEWIQQQQQQNKNKKKPLNYHFSHTKSSTRNGYECQHVNTIFKIH